MFGLLVSLSSNESPKRQQEVRINYRDKKMQHFRLGNINSIPNNLWYSLCYISKKAVERLNNQRKSRETSKE